MKVGKPKKALKIPVPKKKSPFSQFKVSGKGNEPTGMNWKKNPYAPMGSKRLSNNPLQLFYRTFGRIDVAWP